MNPWMPWKRALSIVSVANSACSSVQKIATTSIHRRNSSSIKLKGQLTSNNFNIQIFHNQKRTMSLMNNQEMDKSEDNHAAAKALSIQQSAIIRYFLGDPRFEFKITLRNGKVFNFDRSTTDPLQLFIDRIITNVSKKIKTFDGNVAFLETSTINGNPDGNWEKISNSVPIEDFLQKIIHGSKKVNVQIGEEIYDVSVNPPEIFAIKFLKDPSVGFPIFPIKIETSSNFQRDKSKFIWEFIPASDIKPTKVEVENKPKKNKKGGGNPEVKRNVIWKDTGCRSFVFSPGQDLLGSILKFTCVPSDGNGFGLPFSVELPAAVVPSLAKDPLYLERLSRINSNSTSKNSRKADLDFLRVVSYNCLADTYATEEWFISSPKGCLSVDFRLPFLNKELEAYDADLYCLQEVDEKYFEGHFAPFFNCHLNFKGVFTSKIGNTREGVATFYNPKKLELIRNEFVQILEHMKLQPFWESISSLSWGENKFLTNLTDRNTVLQVSIFKPKATENTILIVANTHLYYHPDADHIRCLQTITCVDYIEKTIKKLKEAFPEFQVALMFCGDFNCTPPFSSYRYLTTGKIEADDYDWTSHKEEKLIPGISREHSLNLKNSHPGEELTNITTCFEGCLDYMLYQPEHFKLLTAYPPPDKSLIASIIGADEIRKVSLPNFNTPSDHLPLVADFLLKSE